MFFGAPMVDKNTVASKELEDGGGQWSFFLLFWIERGSIYYLSGFLNIDHDVEPQIREHFLRTIPRQEVQIIHFVGIRNESIRIIPDPVITGNDVNLGDRVLKGCIDRFHVFCHEISLQMRETVQNDKLGEYGHKYKNTKKRETNVRFLFRSVCIEVSVFSV